MAVVGIVTATNTKVLKSVMAKRKNAQYRFMNLEELGAAMQEVTAAYYNMEWTQAQYLEIMANYMKLMQEYVDTAATQCTHRKG